MKAMVLAARKGTRLFPLTGEIPKPLAPVVDIPLIEHLEEVLNSQGISKLYVNVHYLADAFLEAYGEEAHIDGMSVRFSQEEELMGTEGCKLLGHTTLKNVRGRRVNGRTEVAHPLKV
jgi:mannose-1-phosphate guanylyltransferase